MKKLEDTLTYSDLFQRGLSDGEISNLVHLKGKVDVQMEQFTSEEYRRLQLIRYLVSTKRMGDFID